MKPVSLILLFVLSAATIAGQSTARTLKQAERALGGAKRLQSVRSVTKTGTIRRVSDGAEGRYVFQSVRPNLLNVSYDVDGIETEIGYNGRSAWFRSRDGLRTLTGGAFVDLQTQANFRNNLWLNAKREKSRFSSAGRGTVDGKPVAVVSMTTQKGSVVTLYFDDASGLLLRDEVPYDGRILRTDYDDYRDIGGTRDAFFNRMTLGAEVFEIRFSEIRPNQSIAASEFDFPNMSGRPLPDIGALIGEVQANEDRVEDILDTYSYVQKNIRRELGKDAVLRETGSETFQLSFYKGHRISRMIEKNGKPLSPSDQADADRDAAERAADIERKIAKGESDGDAERGRRISIGELLRASSLKNPRREQFRGRDVIVFDFEPNPAFDYKNAKSMLRFFGKTAGSMWIDEKDKQVARLEAFLADSYKIGGGVVAKLKKGASFTLEQERVNDEIWLPSTADINLSVRLFLVKGIDLNQVIRSYDYRKFTTEVKDAKVNPATQP